MSPVSRSAEAKALLAAAKGATGAIEADGPDEDSAMKAIIALIANYFEEGE